MEKIVVILVYGQKVTLLFRLNLEGINNFV